MLVERSGAVVFHGAEEGAIHVFVLAFPTNLLGVT